MILSIVPDFFCFWPELFLGVFACFLLVFCVNYSTKKFSQALGCFTTGCFSYNSSVFGLAVSLVMVVNNPVQDYTAMWGLSCVNYFSQVVKFIVLFSSFLVLLVGKNYLERSRIFAFEFYFLFLLSIFSILLLVSSNDFIIVYLCLELQALCFYILAAFKKGSAFSSEAGLKYFIVGAFSSAILLFGFSLVYGFCGSLNYEILRVIMFDYKVIGDYPFQFIVGVVFVLSSFFFKLTAAPFHNWAADVYEGAPSFVSMFFSVTPKVALFATIIKFCCFCFSDVIGFFSCVFIVVSVVSLIVGAISALWQKKLKRFFVFSSVTHVGFILLALSTSSMQGLVGVIYYLCIYIVMAFYSWLLILVCWQPNAQKNPIKYISELSHITKQNLVVGFSICLLMFSIAGIPPLAGFGAKFFCLLAVVASGNYTLAFIAVCVASLSCFYYLRVLKTIFFDSLFLGSSFLVTRENVIHRYEKTEAYANAFCLVYIMCAFIYPDFFILSGYRALLFLFLKLG